MGGLSGFTSDEVLARLRRAGVTAWSRRICVLVGEGTVVSASAAVDALLQALASPEGQVNPPARSARTRHHPDRRQHETRRVP